MIPIATGLVALGGAVAYGIMRYSYQQVYQQRRTLQIPDSSVVLATTPARHCHWWDHPRSVISG